MFEYDHLKRNDLFSAIRKFISEDMITVFFHNVRSLSLHIGDIVIDDIIKNNDVIGFTETQISPSDSICIIMEKSNFLQY